MKREDAVVWNVAIGIAAGLVLMWLAVIAVLWSVKGHFDRAALRESLRMLPDLLRLLKRLAADAALPCGVRIRLWLLLAYLIIPVDLVPDFIPIIGYADDAIIVAIALRSVIRHAGPEAIHNHWPGTPGGLTAILRLTAPQKATDASRPSPIHGMSWHVTSCSAGIGEDGLRFGPVDSAGRSLSRQAQDRVAPAEDLRITPAPRNCRPGGPAA
ncbi:MAG TPA: YkvA family protein [Actinoallomurus sp.]